MTLREFITYAMHFNLDAELVFVDNNKNIHHVTNDTSAYLGNGTYDTATKYLKLVSAGIIQNNNPNKDNVNCYETGDKIQLKNDSNKTGIVIGVPACDGGNIYYAPSGSICILLKGEQYPYYINKENLIKIN